MFIVLLRFSENKSSASQFMTDHKAWIKRGFDDGVFLMVGSLQPNRGGCIIAAGIDREALHGRVEEDPFVAEQVVEAEILEVSPNLAVDKLQFLLGQGTDD